MRPYLAILKDSFREAMASRVLLILLIFTTFVLLLLAPVSLTEQRRSQFQMNDFPNPPALAATVIQQHKAAGPSPGKQIIKFANISGAMPDGDNQAAMDDQRLFESLATPLQLVIVLGQILDEPDFYDPPAWADLELSEVATSLVEKNAADLSPDDLRLRNRLLLEAAYPQLISSNVAHEVYLGYAWYQMESALPVSKDDALAWTLDVFTDNILGVFGIMIAILVTASSIPKTYEAGAVDLLLSKPLSRSGVFLTNFLGGCAFILLITTYLIVGMWLIGGIRHGYWNQRFLLCIPLLLFLFAIYYSVSALVGVIWKNAIVSIFVTIAFWCFCFATWAIKSGFESTMASQRLIQLVAASDTMFATNQGIVFNGETRIWDEGTRSWKTVFEPLAGQAGRFSISGTGAPTYDPHQKRLLSVDQSNEGTGGVLDEGTTNRCLYVGDRDGGWKRQLWAFVPDDTASVFVTDDGRYLLVGVSGIGEVSPTREVEEKTAEPEGDEALDQPKYNSYSVVGPDDWSPYTAISMNPRTAAFAVLRGQSLTLYDDNKEGQYSRQSSAQLEAADAQLVAYGNSVIGVSFADGRVRVYDANTLKLRETYQPYGENRVVRLDASPDGRWLAAMYDHRRLWLYDASENKATEPAVWRNDDVSAIAFTPAGSLVVATAFDHVTQYDLASLQTERSFHPSLETAPWIYWYIVSPIYNLFPKPGELGDVVTYLVTGKRTSGNIFAGPQPVAKQLNVWQPLWTNVAFLSVMLGLACLYVHRKDF